MSQTLIDTTDSKNIQRGLSNPAGMLIVNQPDVRQVIAQEIDTLLRSIRKK